MKPPRCLHHRRDPVPARWRHRFCVDRPHGRCLYRARGHRPDHPRHDGRGGEADGRRVRRCRPGVVALRLCRCRRGLQPPGWRAIAALAGKAMDAGAAGVMVAPPGSLLRTDDQIVNYFRSVAEALGRRAFVLQDFPLATGVRDRDIGDPADRRGPVLRHAQARGLAGAGEDRRPRRASEAGARRISICAATVGSICSRRCCAGPTAP